MIQARELSWSHGADPWEGTWGHLGIEEVDVIQMIVARLREEI